MQPLGLLPSHWPRWLYSTSWNTWSGKKVRQFGGGGDGIRSGWSLAQSSVCQALLEGAQFTLFDS